MAKAVSRLAVLVPALLVGCASLGSEALQQSRLQYNEIVKTTSEEQLLLNIVRLRIDRTDQDTKATFSLLMELARLELTGKTGPGPVLTLPVGGR